MDDIRYWKMYTIFLYMGPNPHICGLHLYMYIPSGRVYATRYSHFEDIDREQEFSTSKKIKIEGKWIIIKGVANTIEYELNIDDVIEMVEESANRIRYRKTWRNGMWETIEKFTPLEGMYTLYIKNIQTDAFYIAGNGPSMREKIDSMGFRVDEKLDGIFLVVGDETYSIYSAIHYNQLNDDILATEFVKFNENSIQELYLYMNDAIS